MLFARNGTKSLDGRKRLSAFSYELLSGPEKVEAIKLDKLANESEEGQTTERIKKEF